MNRFEPPSVFYYGPRWQHLDGPPTPDQVAAGQKRHIIRAKLMFRHLVVEGYPESRQVSAPNWHGGPVGDGPCWFWANRERDFRAIEVAA